MQEGLQKIFAYKEAMQILSEKISVYYKNEFQCSDIPDAIYIEQLSNHSERLISKVNSNRCRVFLYIKKSDLRPIGSSKNAVVLTKNDSNMYEPVNMEDKAEDKPAEPEVNKAQTSVEIEQTVSPQEKQQPEIQQADVTPVKQPLSPVLAKISTLATKEEVQKALTTMKKNGEIVNAAKISDCQCQRLLCYCN